LLHFPSLAIGKEATLTRGKGRQRKETEEVVYQGQRRAFDFYVECLI